MSSSSHREVFCKRGLKNSQHSQECACIRVTFYRVLARPYLMTLCVILSIHVNFPITSRCVLKAPIQRKKVNCVTLLEKAFFVSKRRFYGIVHHVVFDYFFHLITICVFFPRFFIYHLSIIFAISRSLRAVLSQYSWKRVVKKEKISRRKYSVDALANTATIRSSHWRCSVRKGVLRNL